MPRIGIPPPVWRCSNHLNRVVLPATLGLALCAVGPAVAAPDPSQVFAIPILDGNPSTIELVDLNADSLPDIVAGDRTLPGLSVHLAIGGGEFAAPIRYLLAARPVATVSGDFDGDGNRDIAVIVASMSPVAGEVVVLHGTGGGSLGDPQPAVQGGIYGLLAAGNFDRDGTDDLALASQDEPRVDIVLAGRTGAFGQPEPFPLPGNPVDLTVGRLDADAVPDLAIAIEGLPQAMVTLGDGRGGLGPPAGFESGAPLRGLATGDLNRDGLADIAVTTEDNQVAVMLGDGRGVFALSASRNPVDVATDGAVSDEVLVADFDADGRPDVATCTPQRLIVVHGDGAGGLGHAVGFRAAAAIDEIDAADLNRDGWIDLAVADAAAAEIRLYLGDDRGTVGHRALVTGIGRVEPVHAADVDGDGGNELIAIGGRYLDSTIVSTYRVREDGALALAAQSTGGLGPAWTLAGDFDGDGRADLATLEKLTHDPNGTFLYLLFGRSDSTLAIGYRTRINGTVYGAAIGDLDDNGRDSLVFAGDYGLSVLEYASSSGVTSAFVSFSGFSRVAAMTLADLNGDRHLDLAATHTNGEVSVVAGFGSNPYPARTRLVAGANPVAIAAGDFDGDGRVDLAVVRRGTAYLDRGSVALLFARPGGGFEATPVSLEADINPVAAAAADVDQDGLTDLVIGHSQVHDWGYSALGHFAVYRNTGSRTFGPHRRFGAPHDILPGGFAVALMDRNDSPDLILAGFEGLSVQFNRSGLADADRDGTANLADPCTDRDGDGFGDPGFAANTCAQDNCPYRANPAQEDRDRDGSGDLCDACPFDPLDDADADGICGDADGCPEIADPTQPDRDADGLGDACDPCTDSDGDGFGDSAAPAGTCPADNCPGTPNPDQADADQDGFGDACAVPRDRDVYPGQVLATGDLPLGIAVEDFNGDGRKDVAVANYASADASIFLAGADGVLEPGRRFPTTTWIREVVAGDFNRDGRPDLAFVSHDVVLVVPAAPDGSFATGTTIPLGEAIGYLDDALAADFDGDGDPDLVIVGVSPFRLVFLRCDGNGGFEEPRTIDPGISSGSVAAGDLTGDGIADLLVSDPAGWKLLTLVGRSDGAFQTLTAATLMAPPGPVGIADFNSDGRLDVAVLQALSSYSYYRLRILTGRGDGTLVTPGLNFYVDLDADTLVVGDLNGDGHPDVITDQPYYDAINVQLGDGAGSLSGFIYRPLIDSYNGIGIGDVSADGVPDLLLLNRAVDSLWVLPGDGMDGLLPRQIPYFSGHAAYVAIDDFNGDLRPDIASPQGVAPGVGEGQFGPLIPIERPAYSTSQATWIATGDFNEDGRRDLVVTFEASSGDAAGLGRIEVLLGQGDGRFDPPVAFYGGASPFAVTVADLDEDAHEDLAAVNGMSGDLDVFLGDGRGGFHRTVTVRVGDLPYLITAGDLDEDGHVDLVVANAGRSYPAPPTDGDVAILMGKGDGSFGTPRRLAAGLYPVAVTLADLNLDRHADLVIANYGSDDLTIFLGRGDGSFGLQSRLPVGHQPFALAAGDFNADRIPDLAASHAGSADVSILLGAGDGGFAPQLRYPADRYAYSIVAAHVDGDRRTDLVVGGYRVLTVLQNIGAFPDTDADGIPDPEDPCTDTDGDGYGDAHLPANLCPVDNCPGAPDPGQTDSDGDGRGDVCDRCPQDVTDDGDRDRVCSDRDNCPIVGNSGQANADGDGFGDACDNCPDVASPDQADSNGDGAGDACQPRLAILKILEDGGNDLEVFLDAGDPQGFPLQGSVQIHEVRSTAATLRDFIALRQCSEVFNPAESANGGIGFVPASEGGPILFDRDWAAPQIGLSCSATPSEASYDFLLAPAACASAYEGQFDYSIYLGNLAAPFPVCVVESDGAYGPLPGGRRFDLVVESIGPDSVELRAFSTSDFQFVFDAGIPSGFSLPSLASGAEHSLKITVTDGTTPPVSAGAPFRYQGESFLLFVGDADSDGILDDQDPCTDADGDGFGDPDLRWNTCVRDNCPGIPNPDQADHDEDGGGDACQPRIELLGIQEDGGADLEVRLRVQDPQDDNLSVWIRIEETGQAEVDVSDLARAPDCSSGYFPPPASPEGIGYAGTSEVGPVLFDFVTGAGQRGLECPDWSSVEFRIARGSCATAPGEFSAFFPIGDGPFPMDICLRGVYVDDGSIWTEYDLQVLAATSEFVRLRTPTYTTHGWGSETAIPDRVDISMLDPSARHRLGIWVSDGTTPAVGVESDFVYQGELWMRFILGGAGQPPMAVISGGGPSECTASGNGVVRLSGAGSSDGDSSPGTHDDIVLFEWFEDHGLPTERAIGTGEVIEAILPLGSHAITLQVTDRQGAADTSSTTVNVQDTRPPTLEIGTDLATLWPPNHRLVPVAVGWRAGDACDPAPTVTLVGVASNEADDLPGPGDGETTGDIGSADVGTPDTGVALRAERSGSGPGRIYELTYTATDASGNRATAVALVTVPHDLGQGPEPLVLRLEPGGSAGAARLYWSGVAGATGYDLLQGNLGELRMVDGHIDLGTVQVLGRGLTGTGVVEEALRPNPRPGRAYFYVMQWREGDRASGYGTESAPLPRQPAGCGGGCP